MKTLFRIAFFSNLIFVVGCATIYSPNDWQVALSRPSGIHDLCNKGARGACALSGQDESPQRPVAILQGLTSSKAARFAVLMRTKDHPHYFIRTESGIKEIIPQRVTFADRLQVVDHLYVNTNNLSKTNQLFIIGRDGMLWDRRDFTAPPSSLKGARILIASCADDAKKREQKSMWREALTKKPQLILLIGDNVYADRGLDRSALPEDLWRRYAETRQKLEVFYADPLVPILATWDDHDYGQNDGDRTFAHKLAAQEVFFAFFPQKDAGVQWQRGPGVAGMYDAGVARFILTDDRSFRSPNGLDIEDQTHFGDEQERWILKTLKVNSTPVVMVSGDQFFGGYHKFESYEGNHPKSFRAQLKVWKNGSRVPILFVSGDRHLTELMKVPASLLGYDTYEFTTSAIHANVYGDAFDKSPSPNQVVGKAGEMNYGYLQILDGNSRRLRLVVTAYGPNSKEIYSKTIEVKK